MLKTFMICLIKKLKANLRLIIHEIKKFERTWIKLIKGEKLVYAHESIIITVIMHRRTSESCKFRRSLGFKLHDVIICKEQTMLESIKDACEGENMKTQYNVLGYKIDVYFHEYKLAIEVDDLGHHDRNSISKIQGSSYFCWVGKECLFQMLLSFSKMKVLL